MVNCNKYNQGKSEINNIQIISLNMDDEATHVLQVNGLHSFQQF